MRAIEATGKIDSNGILRLNNPLILKDKKVKVINLSSEEEEEIEEKLWLKSMNNNPAFESLHDEPENIYKVTDGQLLHD